jgi:GT2 family glycosyltransferase
MGHVTIGFIPRGRYCKAADSLRSIFDGTRIPFHPIVVDCDIPRFLRKEMDEALEGRSNVRIVHGDRSLSSNGSRNLVLEHATDDYLGLIENDVLVEPGWLELLVAACEEHPAEVAVPLLLEPFGDRVRVHFDNRLGTIDRDEDGRLVIGTLRCPGTPIERQNADASTSSKCTATSSGDGFSIGSDLSMKKSAARALKWTSALRSTIMG